MTPEKLLLQREKERDSKLAALDSLRKTRGLSLRESGQYDALKTYSLGELAEMRIIR